jgi:hypothetical protein
VPRHAVTSIYIPCFGLYHFIQTIPKVCIIQTILYNPMITIKHVNDPTISMHYFIFQPVYDSVAYRINYKLKLETMHRLKNVLFNQQLDK